MRYVLMIVAFAELVFSLIVGIYGMQSVMIVGFLGFVVTMFIANVDRIVEVKATATGFEARTRDIIEEAKVSVKEIQTLAKIVAEITLSLVKRTGRMGGYSDEEEDNIKNSIIGILKQLKIRDHDQEKILEEWHRYTIFDYAHCIIGGIRTPLHLPPEHIKLWKTLHDSGIFHVPSPEEIENFIITVGYCTDEAKELIEDYKYYINNKAHRRPDVWKEREHWDVLKCRG